MTVAAAYVPADDGAQICFEELEANTEIARLPCLDTFHADCARAWIGRGHGCPVHSVGP